MKILEIERSGNNHKMVIKLSKRELEIVKGNSYVIGLYPKYIYQKDDESRFASDTVIDVILTFFDITIEEIQNFDRRRKIVEIRMFLAYYLYQFTGLSLEKIGFLINRDHASVMHMIRRRWEAEILYTDVIEKRDLLDEVFNNLVEL